MFNGVRFGFVSALLFCGDTDEDYYVFSERVQAYENEIQFLWSIYQRDQS
ncbi:hypothetical protein [Cupriavidus sp. EM10]|nr:hypothetical protein [Cupriavidus sp. EM10]QWE93320.1 hypothetical protein KLP38_09735 [Cupriavidus sp. EM10]